MRDRHDRPMLGTSADFPLAVRDDGAPDRNVGPAFAGDSGWRVARRAPKGWRRTDAQVRDDVCERLASSPQIDPSDVSVDVVDGVVTIDGTVPQRSMKHRIEDIADGCAGVRDVDNRIRVRRDGWPSPRAERDEARPGALLLGLFGMTAGTPVRDVMSTDVTTVGPDDTLRTAAERMRAIDAGALPVCDGERLCGIVTDRDITIRAVAAGRDPTQTRVADAMSTRVSWCGIDEPIEQVLERMRDLQLRRIPVLDERERLVGIVSLGDVATRQGGTAAAPVLEDVSQPAQSRRQVGMPIGG